MPQQGEVTYLYHFHRLFYRVFSILSVQSHCNIISKLPPW